MYNTIFMKSLKSLAARQQRHSSECNTSLGPYLGCPLTLQHINQRALPTGEPLLEGCCMRASKYGRRQSRGGSPAACRKCVLGGQQWMNDFLQMVPQLFPSSGANCCGLLRPTLSDAIQTSYLLQDHINLWSGLHY